MTVLFDGDCRFFTRSAHDLQRRFGRDRIALRNFQEPGALDAYPGVTFDAAMKRLHVVAHDGRVFAGADAILDGWIFATGGGAIDCVWAGGNKVVEGGRHRLRERARAQFNATIRRLLA